MEISLQTKIGHLLDDYPFLLEYLIKKSPKYSKLKNPLLRKTVAQFASIAKAASLGNLPPQELLVGIAAEIYKNSGESVTLVGTGEKAESSSKDRNERIETFKNIVLRVHDGEPVDSVREEFHTLLKDVSPAEIGAMEQQLVAEGIPESEIKKLCNLHVELFTADTEKPELPPFPEGHPVDSFQQENALAEEKAKQLFAATRGVQNELMYSAARKGFKKAVEDLSHIIRHYERKENQLFPIMEAHGLTAPPQVMWEIHDDIRAMFKEAYIKLDDAKEHAAAVSAVVELTVAIRDMVFKEERVLLPMVVEAFSEDDWRKVRRGEEEIGFAWIDPQDAWMPQEEEKKQGKIDGEVQLDAGSLAPEVINAMLKHLPIDMTFVGPDDRVAYFSQTEERIFPRSEGIIGREVSKCHPPKSVHMVEDILARFKNGERDTAEFWLELNGVFIHIRYFAVRSDGEYLGCLEVSQDVTAIRKLAGEKRLLDWQ